jgi:hypothetical protein
MLWKNDTLPPSSLAFMVTTAAPHHVTMNTAPNTRALSSEAVSFGSSLVAGEVWLDRRMARVRQRMSGPHRSQSFSSAPACSCARQRAGRRCRKRRAGDLDVGPDHAAHLAPHHANSVSRPAPTRRPQSAEKAARALTCAGRAGSFLAQVRSESSHGQRPAGKNNQHAATWGSAAAEREKTQRVHLQQLLPWMRGHTQGDKGEENRRVQVRNGQRRGAARACGVGAFSFKCASQPCWPCLHLRRCLHLWRRSVAAEH